LCGFFAAGQLLIQWLVSFFSGQSRFNGQGRFFEWKINWRSAELRSFDTPSLLSCFVWKRLIASRGPG
jgi:hypothetical protein